MAIKKLAIKSTYSLAYATDSGRDLYYHLDWKVLELSIVTAEVTSYLSQYTTEYGTFVKKASENITEAREKGCALAGVHELAAQSMNLQDNNIKRRMNLDALMENAEIYVVTLSEDDHAQTEIRKNNLKISVVESDRDAPGTLWYNDTEYSHSGIGEGLYADIYVSSERFENIYKLLSGESEPRKAALHLRALLFEDEVDAALKELWHQSHYVLAQNKHTLSAAPLFLEGISAPHPLLMDLKEETIGGLEEEISGIEDSRIPEPPLSDNKIAIAIWALAMAVILHALI